MVTPDVVPGDDLAVLWERSQALLEAAIAANNQMLEMLRSQTDKAAKEGTL